MKFSRLPVSGKKFFLKYSPLDKTQSTKLICLQPLSERDRAVTENKKLGDRFDQKVQDFRDSKFYRPHSTYRTILKE